MAIHHRSVKMSYFISINFLGQEIIYFNLQIGKLFFYFAVQCQWDRIDIHILYEDGHHIIFLTVIFEAKRSQILDLRSNMRNFDHLKIVQSHFLSCGMKFLWVGLDVLYKFSKDICSGPSRRSICE